VRVSTESIRPVSLAVLVAAVLTALLVLLRGVPLWMADFDVYLAAGNAARQGHSLYDLRIDTAAFNDMKYTYPPFAAVLFEPLTFVSGVLVEALSVFVNLLAMGAVLWLTLGMAGISDRRRKTAIMAAGMAATMLLTPVLANTALGQVNVLVMLAVLVDFSPAMPKRWRGVTTGFVVGVKLLPVLFVAYFVCTGNWKPALRAIATFLATVVIGFLVLPSDSREYWLHGVVFEANRVADLADVQNQSIPGLIARASYGMTDSVWWLPVSVVVAVAGLAGATWAYRGGQELLALAVVAFTGILASPVTWPHHVVWIVPVLVWLWFARWRSDSRLPRIVFGVLVVWFVVPTFVLAVPESWRDHQLTTAQQFVVAVSGYFVITLVALVLLPVWSRRVRPVEPIH
jgi:alpha-1,2-mannosyltransferase